MRTQQPFPFEHPKLNGCAYGWRGRREFRRAMRRHYGHPFGFFSPFIGMFWICVGLAFTFSPGFRYAMLDFFSSIGNAFRALFAGNY